MSMFPDDMKTVLQPRQENPSCHYPPDDSTHSGQKIRKVSIFQVLGRLSSELFSFVPGKPLTTEAEARESDKPAFSFIFQARERTARGICVKMRP
jgi:hypothetical protein